MRNLSLCGLLAALCILGWNNVFLFSSEPPLDNKNKSKEEGFFSGDKSHIRTVYYTWGSVEAINAIQAQLLDGSVLLSQDEVSFLIWCCIKSGNLNYSEKLINELKYNRNYYVSAVDMTIEHYILQQRSIPSQPKLDK